MSTVTTEFELDHLTRAQKLQLMEAVWGSLLKAPADLPVPAWHLEELERRIEIYKDQPTAGSSWEAVQARLANRT